MRLAILRETNDNFFWTGSERTSRTVSITISRAFQEVDEAAPGKTSTRTHIAYWYLQLLEWRRFDHVVETLLGVDERQDEPLLREL